MTLKPGVHGSLKQAKMNMLTFRLGEWWKLRCSIRLFIVFWYGEVSEKMECRRYSIRYCARGQDSTEKQRKFVSSFDAS